MESENEADYSLRRQPTLFRTADSLYSCTIRNHTSEVYYYKDKLHVAKTSVPTETDKHLIESVTPGKSTKPHSENSSVF